MPVVISVSQATREYGSLVSAASRTASEIASATLSGCPSVTDSEVNRYSPAGGWLIDQIPCLSSQLNECGRMDECGRLDAGLAVAARVRYGRRRPPRP